MSVMDEIVVERDILAAKMAAIRSLAAEQGVPTVPTVRQAQPEPTHPLLSATDLAAITECYRFMVSNGVPSLIDGSICQGILSGAKFLVTQRNALQERLALHDGVVADRLDAYQSAARIDAEKIARLQKQLADTQELLKAANTEVMRIIAAEKELKDALVRANNRSVVLWLALNNWPGLGGSEADIDVWAARRQAALATKVAIVERDRADIQRAGAAWVPVQPPEGWTRNVPVEDADDLDEDTAEEIEPLRQVLAKEQVLEIARKRLIEIGFDPKNLVERATVDEDGWHVVYSSSPVTNKTCGDEWVFTIDPVTGAIRD